MKTTVLYAFKRNEITFEAMLTEVDARLLGLARWHHRRWQRSFTTTRRVEVEELHQVARLALWQAVVDYRWRCALCARDALTEADFAAHSTLRHGGKATASPTLPRWVVGRVGNAVLGEIRSTVKRSKKRPVIYENDAVSEDRGRIYDAPIPADQEVRIDLARLIEQAGPRVEERARKIRAALLAGVTIAG